MENIQMKITKIKNGMTNSFNEREKKELFDSEKVTIHERFDIWNEIYRYTSKYRYLFLFLFCLFLYFQK